MKKTLLFQLGFLVELASETCFPLFAEKMRRKTDGK